MLKFKSSWLSTREAPRPSSRRTTLLLTTLPPTPAATWLAGQFEISIDDARKAILSAIASGATSVVASEAGALRPVDPHELRAGFSIAWEGGGGQGCLCLEPQRNTEIDITLKEGEGEIRSFIIAMGEAEQSAPIAFSRALLIEIDLLALGDYVRRLLRVPAVEVVKPKFPHNRRGRPPSPVWEQVRDLIWEIATETGSWSDPSALTHLVMERVAKLYRDPPDPRDVRRRVEEVVPKLKRVLGVEN